MTANEECEHGIKRDDHCCWCEGCPTPVGTWRVGRKVGRTIYAQQGPEPSDDDPLIGRIRELEAEVAKLRRERDRARAMVPLPPPDPRMSVRACCGDTHPHGGPECSDG